MNWLTEQEVKDRLQRSKSWLKHLRNGVKDKPAFFHSTEVKNINGRSFRYSEKAIERLERSCNKSAIK